MKIKALNLDIKWKSPNENFLKIEQELAYHSADLFLLPEMFSTGFCMDVEDIADENSETLDWLKKNAKEKNAAIGGSVSVKENDKFYNRFYFVQPNGKVDFYDKKHLFALGSEGKSYSAGNERVIVNYQGFRLLLLICYDLRFPVFARNKGDYDAILCVANWPKQRIIQWENLLKARAIENQAFVFGVNRIGIDGNNLHYPESTFSFFADGNEISERKGDFITAEWNLEQLTNFRQAYPFLKDADEFELYNIEN